MINTCFKRLILEFNYLIDFLKKTYGINYLSNDIMNLLMIIYLVIKSLLKLSTWNVLVYLKGYIRPFYL